MRAAAILLCALVSASVFGSDAGADGVDAKWTELKGKHFIIYYAGTEKFAQDVLASAEKLYVTISEKLGFTRYGGYWLWDERARIWLYATRDDFVVSENAPGWAAGKAVVKGREIKAYETDADFCDTVLPHELSHLIFREFTGLGGDVPLWLDEGVAQLQEKDRKKTGMLLKDAGANGRIIPLLTMISVKPETLGGDGPAVFYAESASIVAFIIDTYGSASFRKFCGALKDGKTVDDALRFTYPGSIRSIEELEKAWLKHLEGIK